jgi:hypothetical protein
VTFTSILKLIKGAIKIIKEYLTPSEASQYTGVSVSLLSKLRQRGTGCTYIRIGESKTKAVVRYRKTDLDEWLNNNRIKTIGGA